jgi:(p)ppGpp synthase/HD superfamily hydrolase
MPTGAHAPQRFPSLVDERPLTRRALEFASVRHRGQRRESDNAPFILHPLEVAQLLCGHEYRDEVVAAAVLHDIVEDADVDPVELHALFGPDVARLVDVLTEPSAEGSYRERKARLRAAVAHAGDGEALVIFAADKVTKARELRVILAFGGDAPPEKLEHYRACLDLLEARLPGHPLVRQLRLELETLEVLPPRAA